MGSIAWTSELDTLAAQTNAAALRQWQALCEPADYAAPFQGPECAGPTGAYTAAMLAADSYAEYCALYAERQPRLCRCDGCHRTVDLEDDGTVVTGDDEVICGKCRDAPYEAEDQ
jgi:hypothetical protein